MKCIAIDPGSRESAVVVYDGKEIELHCILPNEQILWSMEGKNEDVTHLAIEFIASYGKHVGRSVFETLFWTGRLVQAWGGDWTPIYRKEVCKFLCGGNGNDSKVRKALIERFGESDPPKGPLKGIVEDEWAALAVAVYWHHLHEQEVAQ